MPEVMTGSLPGYVVGHNPNAAVPPFMLRNRRVLPMLLRYLQSQRTPPPLPRFDPKALPVAGRQPVGPAPGTPMPDLPGPDFPAAEGPGSNPSGGYADIGAGPTVETPTYSGQTPVPLGGTPAAPTQTTGQPGYQAPTQTVVGAPVQTQSPIFNQNATPFQIAQNAAAQAYAAQLASIGRGDLKAHARRVAGMTR